MAQASFSTGTRFLTGFGVHLQMNRLPQDAQYDCLSFSGAPQILQPQVFVVTELIDAVVGIAGSGTGAALIIFRAGCESPSKQLCLREFPGYLLMEGKLRTTDETD